MRAVDYVILGQGLAGSILALFLLKKKQSLVVIDNEHRRCASKVAAGLVDYISGQRLTKSWLSETLIPFAKNYYTDLEHELSCDFFRRIETLRFFSSEDQATLFKNRTKQASFRPFFSSTLLPDAYTSLVRVPFGMVQLKQTYALHTTRFLHAVRHYLEKKGCLISDEFQHKQLSFSRKGIEWNGISAKKILFCEGAGIRHNPFFQDLDFRFSKGDVLTLSIDIPSQFVLNKNKWLVPFEKNTFRFGASYHWDQLDYTKRKKDKVQLISTLQDWILKPIHCQHHDVGIRCATKDIRPVIGHHPKHPQLAIFNGFSSKGVMSIPYFASLFSETIVNQTPIPDMVHSHRLYHS